MIHTENTEKEKSTKSDKRTSEVLIGVGLIILAAVFSAIALMQPRVSTGGNQDEISEESITSSVVSEFSESTESAPIETDEKQAYALSSIQYPLNLNTCTAEELMTINKIGESRAAAIISYREYLGGYTSVEQLKNISGIGDEVYSAIEPYVTV